MEKYEKQVNFMFLAAALLLWFISRHYVQVGLGYFQVARRIGGGTTEVLSHLVPILIGVATFLILRTNVKSKNFVADSVFELAHVHWPTPKETRFGTLVVIVTVVLAGAVLGLIDIGFVALVRVLIGA